MSSVAQQQFVIKHSVFNLGRVQFQSTAAKNGNYLQLCFAAVDYEAKQTEKERECECDGSNQD